MTRTPGPWPALVVSGLAGSDDAELLQAELPDYDVAAIDEPSQDTTRVFFHAAEARDRAATAIPARFPALTVEALDVADEDWAAKSQESLRAIQVGTIIV